MDTIHIGSAMDVPVVLGGGHAKASACQSFLYLIKKIITYCSDYFLSSRLKRLNDELDRLYEENKLSANDSGDKLELAERKIGEGVISIEGRLLQEVPDRKKASSGEKIRSKLGLIEQSIDQLVQLRIRLQGKRGLELKAEEFACSVMDQSLEEAEELKEELFRFENIKVFSEGDRKSFDEQISKANKLMSRMVVRSSQIISFCELNSVCTPRSVSVSVRADRIDKVIQQIRNMGNEIINRQKLI